MKHAHRNLETDLRAKGQTWREAESGLADMREENRRLRTALAAVHASWSWRITWPLRATSGFLNRGYHTSKHIVYSLVIKSANFVLERPRLTKRVSALLGPGLRRLLNSLLSAAGWNPDSANGFHPRENRREQHNTSKEGLGSAHDLSELSEAARKVYWDLKTMVGKGDKEEG